MHILGPSMNEKIPLHPWVREVGAGIPPASSHRSGRKTSASGPQTVWFRLMAMVGTLMSWKDHAYK